MQEILLVFSAVFCVGSRAALSLYDRSLFGQKKGNFYAILLGNAINPFFTSLAFAVLFFCFDTKLLNWFFDWGIICNGIAAQLTATAFSYAFRHMPVRSVVISSKLTDLLIPLVLLLFAKPMQTNALLFSQLTTVIFFPLAYLVIKQKELHWVGALLLASSLLLQAALSISFEMFRYCLNWQDFIRLMVCVIGWRVIILSIGFFHSELRKQVFQFPSHSMHNLIARGILAYLSQSSFFFCVISPHQLLAWPILNTGPLVSCFAAGLFLGEGTGKMERTMGFALVCILFSYLFLQWRNL